MCIASRDFIQRYKNVILISAPSTNCRKRRAFLQLNPTVQKSYVNCCTSFNGYNEVLRIAAISTNSATKSVELRQL